MTRFWFAEITVQDNTGLQKKYLITRHISVTITYYPQIYGITFWVVTINISQLIMCLNVSPALIYVFRILYINMCILTALQEQFVWRIAVVIHGAD